MVDISNNSQMEIGNTPPPTKEVLEKAGLYEIDKYIRRRRETVFIMYGREIFINNAKNLDLLDSHLER